MKKVIRNTIVQMMLLVLPVVTLMADPPQPPSPGGTPVGTGTPVGAPVDDGLLVLMAMGIIYGLSKIYQHRNRHHSILKEK